MRSWNDGDGFGGIGWGDSSVGRKTALSAVVIEVGG
jgi:hypothetical protein